MPDGTVPLLVAIIVLVIFSAFFSCTETAFSCANRIKLRSLASSGNKRAEKVLVLAEEKFDKLLSTILIGNNIVNITATTLATLLFEKCLKGSSLDSSVVSTVVMTVSILILGEITPKIIAKSYPEKLALAFYPVIKFFYYLLFVFNSFFSGWKWLISKILRKSPEDVITEDEIMTVVEEAEEDGTLKEDETKLIRSVIEFDDVEVGDILVPRVNIAAVEVNSSMEEVKEVFIREGYSRIPVYKESIDTIIGSVHEKDFFSAYLNGKTSLEGIMQKAFYTTEHVKISLLLKQLQKSRTHMAVVLDEYAGTLGIVTLEDILEELVGEIWDEHDEEINYIKQISEKEYLIDGNASRVEVFEFFKIKEDEEFDSNTLSGWIIEELEEIPHAGKKFDYKNLTIEILKSTVKRILQVKITVNTGTETEE